MHWTESEGLLAGGRNQGLCRRLFPAPRRRPTGNLEGSLSSAAPIEKLKAQLCHPGLRVLKCVGDVCML